jgi:hypothetical protein
LYNYGHTSVEVVSDVTTKSLNKGFGREHPNTIQTKIEEDNVDNIEEHASKLTLKLGNAQTIQLSSTNGGPRWMYPAQDWLALLKKTTNNHPSKQRNINQSTSRGPEK